MSGVRDELSTEDGQDIPTEPPTTDESPGPAPAREVEHRQITVMFCDLVGSTALSERLDPEGLRRLMRAYRQACAKVFERYEGHVAQRLGDGLMIYFGWPRAREDDAERAVRAGLEVVEAVKAIEAPEPLRVRLGVATGPAAVGETASLAARLQGLAGPDEIVIAPSTHRLVGGAFAYDDLGERELKGIVEPVRAWRVTGLGNAESRFGAMHPGVLTPLVGRESEIAMVMERWRQAKDGDGQVVLLGGERGIGKSRVTQALRERTAAEPHVSLRYQCSPYHAGSALHPVIRQIERAAGFARDDTTETKLDKLEALLAGTREGPLLAEEGSAEGLSRTCALFAALVSLPTDRYPPPAMSPQKQKEETLRALVAQVLATARPALLIFEDAQWIDPTSQELLDLLVPAVAAAPALVVITHRPEYAPPWHGHGHLTPLVLARLGRDQAAAMVAGVAGGRDLPEGVVDQIVTQTAGVPLLIEELTKTVLESGVAPPGGEGAAETRVEAGGAAWVAALEAGLHEQWQLGRNIVLSWCPTAGGLDLVVVPHYFTATFAEKHRYFFDDEAELAGEALPASRSTAEFLRGLITGSRRLEPGRFATVTRLLGVAPVRIALPEDVADPRHVAAIDRMVERYSVSYVANRAVVLLDIVGFARLGPAEQTSQLNSLAYSVNATHAKLSRNEIDVDFARSTTGDGFYIWNRDTGPDANTNLYHFMHIALADNAIARSKSEAKVTPLLRAGFHIGDYYAFYQAEGLNPTVYSYIVGTVTIELARIIDQTLAGQVLLGDFTVPLAGVGEVDSEGFIAHLQDGLSRFRGMRLSGEEITDIKCYLTGDRLVGGGFAVRRYPVTDKHGYRRVVYNAKINIYRRHGEPILLGIQDQDLWRLRWRLRREA